MDLVEVGEEREGSLVAKGHVDETVVGEGAHRGESGRFLSTSKGTSGDEETSVAAVEATGGPDTASTVPEGLPLSREVTVTGGDTEEDGIVVKELLGLLQDGDGRLLGSVHLVEDLLGEGLRDPNDVM